MNKLPKKKYNKAQERKTDSLQTFIIHEKITKEYILFRAVTIYIGNILNKSHFNTNGEFFHHTS